jgi:zinc protease
MHMRRFIAISFVALILIASAPGQTLPPGVQKLASVEGVTEYAFPNGLHLLLFPDSSKPKLTINIVYLVGSRNEGYGETGMAHLLEHMVFKTTKSGQNLFKELTDRAGGGNFNGTTSYDQTMYFETLTASDENLRWGLALEAERMVNMTMEKKDLDSEMTVVRNEMESGENNPGSVLQKRVLAAAYNFHNYGKTVIGARSDVERVPIDNLAVFYRKYYQPDNAVLIVAGQFNESKALAYAAESFGKIPKPQRALAQPYTVEPTQEGERSVILRRVGDIQYVMAVYHAPAALHPDSAPLDVLEQILGASQTGRIYKALVDGKKAVSAGFSVDEMRDPGYALAYAVVKQDQSIDEAAQLLLKTVEGFANDPPTREEMDRAKSRILKNHELMMANSQSVGQNLGSYVGSGDWRLLFLNRDEIKKTTPEDVARVAKAYLKSTNRTLGEFIPTKDLNRSEIPATPSAAERLKDYKGGEPIQQGEAFDPTPKNIEARVIRAQLPNGLKLLMLPKKTRGGAVAVTMNVRFGDEKSLFGKSEAGSMAGALLMRGTKNKTRQQIQDETDRLKAQVSASGGVSGISAGIRTFEPTLGDSLRLVRELLREPAFPETEFEQIRQMKLASIENARSDPASLTSLELNRHLNARYPRGDARYVSTLDEEIEDVKKVTLDDVRRFYAQFYGVGEGELAIVGQFDPAQMQKLAAELFGDWKSPARYERIPNSYIAVNPINRKIETPDKQNAYFLAAMFTKATDEDPDYAALQIAGYVFGGAPTSRVFQRIRVKEGLSYGANASFTVPTKDDCGSFSASAISAPQNTPKTEAAFMEEIAKAIKEGFTADEVEKAKKAWLDNRAVSRAEDTGLAGLLANRARWDRTVMWDEKLEKTVAALTPAQVSEAFRRHVDPVALSIVKGGDFKKAKVYQ